MRTLIRSTLLALLAFFSLQAFADEDLVSKIVPVQDFDRIEASSAVKLTIEQSDTTTLTVTTTEEAIEQVTIKLSGSTLKLGLKRENRGLFNWGWGGDDDKVYFRIQMPDLKQLKLSGASKVQIKDMQLSDLQIKASGASKIAVDKLRLNNLDIDASGASKLSIKEIDAKEVKAEISGASKIKVSEGTTEYLDVRASGASKFSGEKLISNHAKVRASGASKITVNAKDLFESHSSGASKIINRGPASK